MSQSIPRRALWANLLQAVTPDLPAPAPAAATPAPTYSPPTNLPPVPLRPPGALPEPEFLTVCERCSACAEACEPGAILSLGEAYGAAEGTPGIFPAAVGCELCPDLPCVAACPSGALVPPDNLRDVQMGLAHINPSLCFDAQGTACDACALVCPQEIRAIRMTVDGPAVNSEACTGCGLCVTDCPAEPKGIHIRPTT